MKTDVTDGKEIDTLLYVEAKCVFAREQFDPWQLYSQGLRENVERPARLGNLEQYNVALSVSYRKRPIYSSTRGRLGRSRSAAALRTCRTKTRMGRCRRAIIRGERKAATRVSPDARRGQGMNQKF